MEGTGLIIMNWALLLSGASLTVAIIAQILIGNRNQKKESEERGREMGTITGTLKEIHGDVAEMKMEQRTMSDKADKRHETMIGRLALVEASTKSAHKRIDEITGKKGA